MNEVHQCTVRDLAGLKLKTDAPAKAVQALPTAYDEFLDALEELLQFTAEDAISVCQALPGGGCREPDRYTADRLYALVLDAAKKAFQPEVATPAVDNGLTIVRGLGEHCSLNE